MRACFGAVAAILVAAPAADGQRAADRRGASPFTSVITRHTSLPAASRTVSTSSLFPLRRDDESTPRSVTVDTRGAELLVVRVPVPSNVRLDGLLSRRPAQFRVAMARHAQFIGATTGSVDLLRDTTLVLALRVSRRAPAGRSLAGTVEFWVGTTSALMPIEIEVPVAHRLTLAPPTRSVVAIRGRWSSMALRVLNDGNVDEPVELHADVPDGWRVDLRRDARPSPSRVVAGGTMAITMRVWVPASANAGIATLPVALTRPDSAPYVTPLQIDVLGEAAGTLRGPTVSTSYVAGQSGEASAMHGYGVTIDGNLSDSTRISGRISYAGEVSSIDGAAFALARAGVITTPPSLEIEHPRAQLRLGATSGAFPELAGQFLAGTGAITRVSRARMFATAFDLSPMALQRQFSLASRAPGRFSGGELGIDVGTARTAIFGASLRDPITRRQLDVTGGRLALGNPYGSNLISEVAHRSHAGGSAVGYMTALRLVRPRTSVDLRVMHAPGGSRAFARASDEAMLNVTRTLGSRSSLALGAWSQNDDNLSLGSARSRGWFAMPMIAVTRAGSIGLETRHVHFSAGTDAGRLVTDELSGGGSLNVTLSGTQLTARSVVALLDRALDVPMLRMPSSRQWRLDHMLLASRTSARGTLSMVWMQQQYSGVSGVLPRQTSLHVRADRFRPWVTHGIHIDAEAQRMQLGAASRPYWLARSSLTVPLVAGTSVAFSVERNPFMAASRASRRQPLLYTVRIDRSTMLPRPFAGPRGLVYRDDNGNGRRDRGERGVPGVVVSCGSARVVTDGSGRYPCSQRRHEVDARTVPTGLVLTRSTFEANEAIALRVVQPLIVEVRVPPADSARVSSETLSKLTVLANDIAGGTWTARPLGGGRFLIDALPVGRYTIAVDAGAADEPLMIHGARPTVDVGAHDQPTVELTVRPRPMNIRAFAPGSIPSPPVAPPSPAGVSGRRATPAGAAHGAGDTAARRQSASRPKQEVRR